MSDRERLEKFFLDRTEIHAGDCWLWTGSIHKDGYGEGSPMRHKKYMAHRLAYELYVGQIPDGLTIDHLCRNRRCVNPEHLRTLTIKENVLCGNGITAMNARKTHCPQGHPYEGDNLYTYPSGFRACLTCRREHGKAQRKRNKENAMPQL